MADIVKCCNCNIVVNELLAFVINKLHIMDDESMCRICVAFFTTQDIKTAKDLLFQSVPAQKRKIIRKKAGQERRDIDDILQLIKVTEPDKFPVFVARDLHKLPPIDFDSVDLSSLLKDIVILKNELQTIKTQYVTMDHLNFIATKIQKESERVPNTSDYFCRNVSNSNINLRRGAYLDSGPIGLSHFDMSSPSKLYADEHSSKLPSSPQKTRNSPSLTPAQERVEKSRCNVTAAPARAESPESCPSPSPAQQPTITAASQTSKHASLVISGNGDSSMTDQLINGEGISDSHGGVNSDILSYANITRHGEWKTVERRPKSKNINRFIGKTGIATTDINCKFKAAESKIPILITNVHKDTSKTDIIGYIHEKTRESVELKQIAMKYNNKYHNAYKFYVSKHKLDMFLDESLWPKNIIFRRFVTTKYNFGSDKAVSATNATNATSATSATVVSPKAING